MEMLVYGYEDGFRLERRGLGHGERVAALTALTPAPAG
jgi:hypothetical protein